MDAYKCMWAQQQGYGHPLQLFMSRKVEEKGKTTWGKSSLKKGQGIKYEQHVFHMSLSSLERDE